MTYEVYEVNEILKLEYGKDCGGIIMDFIYPKCEKCNELFHEDKIFDTYNGSYVCIYCYTKLQYRKCVKCILMYEYNKGIYCSSCRSNCKIYCKYCLNDFHKTKKILSITLNQANSILDN